MSTFRLIVLSICLIILAACSSETGAIGQQGLLFEDDFSTDRGVWLLESDQEAQTTIKDGRLDVNIESPNLIAWAELEERKFGNFILTVDASQIDGPDNNSYGVVFRMQDANSYYRFDISGDGYLAFTRRDPGDGGQWTWIIEDWLETPAIKQGANTNQIKIVAQGSHFEFFINDQSVAEADDATYTSGTIGLDAGSFYTGGVKISFDNLSVRSP